MSNRLKAASEAVKAASETYQAASKKAREERQKKINDLNDQIYALQNHVDLPEYIEYKKVSNEHERLRHIEAERDRMANDIYIRLTSGVENATGVDDHFYKRAMSEANSFIKNKHNETLD